MNQLPMDELRKKLEEKTTDLERTKANLAAAEAALLKEINQSEARAWALLESAPQGVIAANRVGEIVQANDAALEIFGYSREELLGQSVDMLLPQEFQPSHTTLRGRYFSAPEVRPMGTGRALAGLGKDPQEFQPSHTTLRGRYFSAPELEIGLSSVLCMILSSWPSSLTSANGSRQRKQRSNGPRKPR